MLRLRLDAATKALDTFVDEGTHGVKGVMDLLHEEPVLCFISVILLNGDGNSKGEGIGFRQVCTACFKYY